MQLEQGLQGQLEQVAVEGLQVEGRAITWSPALC